MKQRLISLLILITLFLFGCNNKAVSKSNGEWLTNMPEAQKIAAKKDLPIMINFTGSDWCSWCHKLRDEVFSQAEFKDYAKESLVLVELDFPKNIEQSDAVKKHNDKYMKMFDIKGFPTILVVDADLNILTLMGYQPGGPEQFIKDMESSIVFPEKNYDSTITTENGITWTTSMEKAKDDAKRTGKKIFVNFTGSDWCGWCTRLDEEILSTEKFMNFAKENLIMLYLDYPQETEQPDGMRPYNQKVAAEYSVRGFPTILILDEEGKELKRLGYEKEGADKFISDIKSALK